MIDERHEELASLYALELLEGAERAAFAAALDGDPALRQRVRELREAAAALARTAPPAELPAALKERIMHTASAQRPARAEPAARASILSFSRLTPWALAACLALAAVWIGQLYLTSRSETRVLREQQALADLELRSRSDQLEEERILSQHELKETREQLADAAANLAEATRKVGELSQTLKVHDDLAQYKISTLASMLGNTPQALAVAVWCPSMQKGILSVAKLPALPANKDYQLWVIDPQYASPVSGGVFRVDPVTGEARMTFETSHPVKSIAKFAVSLERKGGVLSPQGPIVLLSD